MVFGKIMIIACAPAAGAPLTPMRETQICMEKSSSSPTLEEKKKRWRSHAIARGVLMIRRRSLLWLLETLFPSDLFLFYIFFPTLNILGRLNFPFFCKKEIF